MGEANQNRDKHTACWIPISGCSESLGMVVLLVTLLGIAVLFNSYLWVCEEERAWLMTVPIPR